MTTPVKDFRGRAFFICTSCGEPLGADDFVDLGLRSPDDGESREEYCDAELIDSVQHSDCLRAQKAS